VDDQNILYFKFSRSFDLEFKYGYGLAISAIQYLEDLNAMRKCAFWKVEQTNEGKHLAIDLDLFIAELNAYSPPD
jgi:hypothetical protein